MVNATYYPKKRSGGTFSPMQGEYTDPDDAQRLPISVLDEHICRTEHLMLEYENKAMYLEAEKQRQLLQRLKKASALPLNDTDFKSEWTNAIKDVEQMNQQKRLEFEQFWKARLKEHSEKSDELLEVIKHKHHDRCRELAQATERVMRFPKWTTVLLELRRKQYLLAKTKRYLEAEAIKLQAEEMEAKERSRLLKIIDKDNKLKMTRLNEQHQREIRVIVEKMEIERKGLVEVKQQLHERLNSQCRHALADVQKRARIAAKRRQRLNEELYN